MSSKTKTRKRALDTESYQGSDDFQLLLDNAQARTFELEYEVREKDNGRKGYTALVRAIPMYPECLVNPLTGEVREYFAFSVKRWESLDADGNGRKASRKGKKAATISLAVEAMTDLEIVKKVKGWVSYDKDTGKPIKVARAPMLYPQHDWQCLKYGVSAIDISAVPDAKVDQYVERGNFGVDPKFLCRYEVLATSADEEDL